MPQRRPSEKSIVAKGMAIAKAMRKPSSAIWTVSQIEAQVSLMKSISQRRAKVAVAVGPELLARGHIVVAACQITIATTAEMRPAGARMVRTGKWVS